MITASQPETLAPAQSELALASDLLRLLEQEHLALKQGHALLIGQIIQEKQLLLEQLEQLTQARPQQHTADASTQAQLQVLAEQIQELNRRNGAMIHQRLALTEQALQCFQEQHALTDAYGADGQKQKQSHSRIRGKA